MVAVGILSFGVLIYVIYARWMDDRKYDNTMDIFVTEDDKQNTLYLDGDKNVDVNDLNQSFTIFENQKVKK